MKQIIFHSGYQKKDRKKSMIHIFLILQKGLTYEELKKQLGEENAGVTSVNEVRLA